MLMPPPEPDDCLLEVIKTSLSDDATVEISAALDADKATGGSPAGSRR